MTNDWYLIISYFAVAALAIVFAGATWFYLRRSFGETTEALSTENLSRTLKAMFPAGLFLPAFLGFISVSYRGCNKSYAEIVKERSYLIRINQQQISSILVSIAGAVLFWDLVILLALRFGRAGGHASGESPDIRLP